MRAAVEFANREVVKWAVGEVEKATGETSPDKLLGWFINDFDNTIIIRGVGTENQSDTKVDMEMTCSKPEECPISNVTIDGAGDLKGNRQLARLSLKAGSVPHFGGGAATSADRAIGVMESVFAGGQSLPEVQAWKTTFGPVFDGNDQDERRLALYKLVEIYAEHAEKMMKRLDGKADEKFLESMIEGLLKHSVRGKNKYAAESGLVLVQSTEKGDFYKLEFDKLPEVLGDGSNFDAKATLTSGGSPYLVVYQSRGKDPQGSPISLPEPASHTDENVLFWIRTLARTGAEILRLEKGTLAKKVLAVPVGQRLVYRDGEVVAIPDDQG